jgi:hypothetical protein
MQEVDEDGEVETFPFTQDEFQLLVERLQALPPVDLEDEDVRDRLRYRNMVPIENVTLDGPNRAFGVYRGAYWGHAFENTDKGKIPADSINLRPFYFLIYRSKSGRIYLGVQYLAQYGSYVALKNTITRFLPAHKKVVAHSFRFDAPSLENLEPKEIRVHLSSRAESRASENVFGESALVAFKRKTRGDTFTQEVKKKLIPFIGTSTDKVKKAVASILNESALMDVDDDEIVGCTIFGEVNGRPRTVYMMGQGSFASQFPLSVTFNDDGHPEYAPTKQAMFDTLAEQIIARKENA